VKGLSEHVYREGSSLSWCLLLPGSYHNLFPLNPGSAIDLCVFTSGRLAKRCCCGAESSLDLFVLDLGRASDLGFFRTGRVCVFRVVCLGLSLADFFPSGSIRVC